MQDRSPVPRRQSAARRPGHYIVPLLLLALLVAFGMRVYRLGDNSIWWDEGLAAWSARQSLVEIAQWTSADVHPPLYFWMLHFWRLLSGDSEFGLRFLSAGIGVLTVAATYLLAYEVARREVAPDALRAPGRWAGLLAAALLALSRFDVWWSQEARMYALAALWAALALWAAVRFWDRGRWLDAGLYALFTCAGLYTLYLGVSVLVIANLVWVGIVVRSLAGRASPGDPPRDARLWTSALRWIAAQVAVLAVFMPWLTYALGRMPTWSSASPVKLGVFLRIYWTVLTLGISLEVERYAWLTLPLLAVFLVGLGALGAQAWRERRATRNLALLALGVLLPAGVVYLVSRPREILFYSPQLAPRYLILFAPAFYVLLAWGTLRLGEGLSRRRWMRARTWVRGTLAALILGAAVLGLVRYYPERILTDDWKSLVATLRAYERPQDAVVLYTDQNWPVFSYHYADSWFKIPHALRVTPQEAEAYLSPIWETHEGLWLVVTPYAGINDPLAHVPAWLDARATAVVEHRYVDKVLRFYARTGERAESAHRLAPDARPPRALQVDLESGLRLVGYGQPVREVRAGDAIHLALYWEQYRAAALPARGVQAGLVAAAEGSAGDGRPCSAEHAWNRVRAPLSVPAAALNRQQIDLLVPPDAPAGRYAVALQALPGETTVCLGEIVLRPWAFSGAGDKAALDRVASATPLELDFEDGVHLIGYKLSAEQLVAGETLYLTLYWRARAPVAHRYKVFTHLLGEVYHAESGGFVWGQQDNEPVNGARPTSTWRSGEVIEDVYALPVDPKAPAGTYTVEVGMYDPATLARLAILDSTGQVTADHVLLAAVRIEDNK